MADFGGGIPGQVASELAGIVKDSARAVVGAGVDIAKGTVEKIVTAGMPQTPTQAAGEGQAMEQGQAQADPQAALKQQKDAAAKRRLSEVRGELQAYFEEQKKKKEQEEQVAEEQKKTEEIQIKSSKKKQEEKQILGRLSRQYGGTGEVGKSGY
ncbi:MAG: hypothetical protein AAB548_03320 [Patescibacteria group bacterium]